MSSAEAPSAAVRTMTPPFAGTRSLRMSFSRCRSASSRRRDTPSPSPFGTKTRNRPGQRDLGREPGALRLHRVLHRLHEEVLAALDQVGDLLPVPLSLELGHDDLVHVQEAVLLEPDLDERRLHPGKHVVDRPEVDVPGDRAPLGPLEVDLGDPVVLEQRDALLADVDGDQELALRLRKRRAARRLPTALPATLRAPVRRCASGPRARTGAAALSSVAAAWRRLLLARPVGDGVHRACAARGRLCFRGGGASWAPRRRSRTCRRLPAWTRRLSGRRRVLQCRDGFRRRLFVFASSKPEPGQESCLLV